MAKRRKLGDDNLVNVSKQEWCRLRGRSCLLATNDPSVAGASHVAIGVWQARHPREWTHGHHMCLDPVEAFDLAVSLMGIARDTDPDVISKHRRWISAGRPGRPGRPPRLRLIIGRPKDQQ